jgi:hypothetical protein
MCPVRVSPVLTIRSSRDPTFEPDGSTLVAWSVQACYLAWVRGVWAVDHLGGSVVVLWMGVGSHSPRVIFF